MTSKAHFVGDVVLRALKPDQLIERYGSSRVQYWEVMQPFQFVSVRFMLTITVPKGFFSDLASVPRVARWLIDNDDPGVLTPALVHDYICLNEGEIPEGPFDRKEADDIMHEGTEVCGLKQPFRQIVYMAIRAGGKWSKRNT